MRGPSIKHIRVLIVEPHQLVAMVLRETVERDPALAVVGFARDSHEAFEGIERLHPDLMLVDLTLPGGGGFRVVQKLVGAHNQVPVVLIGEDPETDYEAEAQRIGAAYLTWGQAVQELTALIRRVVPLAPYDLPLDARRDLTVLAELSRGQRILAE